MAAAEDSREKAARKETGRLHCFRGP